MPLILNGTTGVSGVDGSAGTPSYQGTDTNTGIFYPAADTIAFAEGGVEVARFDSSGNLGIGTSSPNTWTTSDSRILTVQSSGDTAINIIGGSSSASLVTFGSSTVKKAAVLENGSSNLLFYTNATNTGTTLTERMRIDSSGNVGIGTSSPLARLDVVFSSGRNRFRNSTGGESFAMFQNTDTGTNDDGLLVGIGADEVAYVYNYENTALVFGTNATERMRIDSSGRVTTPFQPAFRATGNSATNTVAGNPLIFNTIDFDIGSNYNTSNGRFTAPIAGIYVFYICAVYCTGGTSPTFKLDWRVNNAFHAVASEWQFNMSSGGAFNTIGNAAITISLAAGDYVNLHVTTGSYHISSAQTKFGGYLLG